MTVNCLFAENKKEKYVVLGSLNKGFAHLRDLLAYLDQTLGKGEYRLNFKNA